MERGSGSEGRRRGGGQHMKCADRQMEELTEDKQTPCSHLVRHLRQAQSMGATNLLATGADRKVSNEIDQSGSRTGGGFIRGTLAGRIGRPMELRDPIRLVLKHKGGTVWSVPSSASVYDAIAVMGEKQVGALLVMEDAKLVDIVSERDYARKALFTGSTQKKRP